MPSNYMNLIEEIWALNRVHIGPETLAALQRTQQHYSGSTLLTYPVGSCYGAIGSWEVPPGWRITKGQLQDSKGNIIADITESPLRVFSYSPSFNGIVTKETLNQHILTDPEQPDAIPFHFRNQYRHWSPEWGFCLTQHEFDSLSEEQYTVDIATEFYPTDLVQLEYCKQGEVDEYFLLLGHFDHPAQCNDGLTGCIVANEVIRRLRNTQTHYSYRSLNTIEIVGSVAYCDSERLKGIQEALFIAAPGANANYAYQQSSQPKRCLIDRIVAHLLQLNHPNTPTKPFRELWGNDEIAFETPGIDTRCSLLARHPLSTYHTHFDDFESINQSNMEETIEFLLRVISIIEDNRKIKGLYQGLPCFSHPSFDLYLDINNFDDWDSDKRKGYFADMTDQETDYVLKNPRLCNSLMNNISPLLIHKEYDILTLSEEFNLPFFFIRNYARLLEHKGLISLSRS